MAKLDRFLLIVLTLSLIGNVMQAVLVRQSHGMTPILAKKKADIESLPRNGQRFDQLHLVKVNGETADIRFDSNEMPVVAYVFSPTCKWCKLNRRYIDSLARELQEKYRGIGISNTSKDLPAYVAENPSAFPVYYVDGRGPDTAITMAVTPRTLVFSPDRHFIRGWNGAYLGATKAQIMSYFHANLPD